MASQTNTSSLPSMDDQTAALNKCISIFQSSKTDNERFAALLLVTRLVHSSNIDSAQRRLLYDAIGFTFINRLLKTKSGPENGMYQALAIAILACFATDQELLLHPQMVSKVEVLNEIITNPAHEKSTVDDVYQILSYFSSFVDGCKVLSQKGTVYCLCDIIMSGSDQSKVAWEVLLNIASLAAAQLWNTHPKPLIQLVAYSAEKLRTLQDFDKFTCCSNLLSLLSHTDAEAFRNALSHLDNINQLLSDFAAGLGDILQGKVTSCQRDPALVLVSVMVELLDNNQKQSLLTNYSTDTNKADFFTLVTTSVSIEIRMILDESTTEQLIEKATLLTSCYNILENIIAYLITMTDIDNNTQGTQVTKLYSQITEAMVSVLAFLQQQSVKYDEKLISCPQEFDIVLASARVLLAWLAEESMALQKDVNKVVPFLITVARDTLPADSSECETQESELINKNGDVEMIRLMLPALCHLSSDEKSRKILIENSLQDILIKYYQVLWKRCQEDNTTTVDSKTPLVTLLGVFLNFAVTEQKLVTNDNSFKELLLHILANISTIANSRENIDLLAHLAVLGLMLFRYQKESIVSHVSAVMFFKSVVLFMKEADKLRCSQDDQCKSLWSSVCELWFLGGQVIQEFSDPTGLVAKAIPGDVFHELVNASSLAEHSGQ